MKFAGINKLAHLLLILAVYPLLGHAQELSERHPIDRTHFKSNPLMEAYDVKFYGLDLRVDNRSDRISGNATILLEVMQSGFNTLVFDLYGTLQVGRVLVDGAEVDFTQSWDQLSIDLGKPRESGSLVSAQIFYGGETGEGMVMEVDKEWGVPVTYTSSEPFYSMDWFPCKQSLEDKADSVHVFITTDFALMAVSNGLLTGTTYFPNGKVRYQWKSNYPLPIISSPLQWLTMQNIRLRPGLQVW